jgi:hypothetical protein
VSSLASEYYVDLHGTNVRRRRLSTLYFVCVNADVSVVLDADSGKNPKHYLHCGNMLNLELH